LLGYIGIFGVGFVLGLLGGGGSILSVPVLVYLFGIPAAAATVYSLFIVGSAALLGMLTYLRQGLVNFKVALLFLFPSMIGVTLSRRRFLPGTPAIIGNIGTVEVTRDRLILFIFSIVMALAAYSMLRTRPPSAEKKTIGPAAPFIIAIYGIVAGVLMGFVGAGGGFLIIPILVGLGRLDMKVAVASSLLIIASSSLFGFAGDVWAGVSVDYRFLLTLALFSFAGVFVGTRLSGKIPAGVLKRTFGYLIMAVALFILVKEIFFSV